MLVHEPNRRSFRAAGCCDGSRRVYQSPDFNVNHSLSLCRQEMQRRATHTRRHNDANTRKPIRHRSAENSGVDTPSSPHNTTNKTVKNKNYSSYGYDLRECIGARQLHSLTLGFLLKRYRDTHWTKVQNNRESHFNPRTSMPLSQTEPSYTIAATSSAQLTNPLPKKKKSRCLPSSSPQGLATTS